MFATGEIVGLAEWIIDDTCLVMFYIFQVMYGILVFVMLVLDVKLVIAYPTPVNNKVFAFGAGA